MVHRSMTAWRFTEHNIGLCHSVREDQPVPPVEDSSREAMYTEELHDKQLALNVQRPT